MQLVSHKNVILGLATLAQGVELGSQASVQRLWCSGTAIAGTVYSPSAGRVEAGGFLVLSDQPVQLKEYVSGPLTDTTQKK